MEMQIDFSKPEFISQYGISVQQNLAKFSEQMLTDVKNKDTAEIGALLNELMLTVKGINLDDLSHPGIFKRIWHKILSEMSLFRGGFEKINDQLNFLVKELEIAKSELVKDIQNLDQTYEQNLEYFQELELLIENADDAIFERERELGSPVHGDVLAIQKHKDQKHQLHEFEKRVHDLKLTKNLTLQTLPQIRFIQHNNTELMNKIQSAILNTIPIWKNQIILTLSLERQRRVVEIQERILETTNTLVSRNSEMLKENSLNVAELGEKGILEVQSLQKVNDDLISSIAGVLQIYKEGKLKRVEAEKELNEMERRLKATLAM